jgi:hypothetical protein
VKAHRPDAAEVRLKAANDRVALADRLEPGSIGVGRQRRQGRPPGSLGVLAVRMVHLTGQCAVGILTDHHCRRCPPTFDGEGHHDRRRVARQRRPPAEVAIGLGQHERAARLDAKALHAP